MGSTRLFDAGRPPGRSSRVRLVSLALLAVMLLAACAERDDNDQCSSDLALRREEVARRTVETIEQETFKLEQALEARAGQERKTDAALEKLRSTAGELDEVYSEGCA